MPTLYLFILLALTLSAMLAMIVILPWVKQTRLMPQDNQLLALNIDVFKQRLNELEADFNAQQIDKPTYDSQKLALERQLLDISESQDKQSFVPNHKSQFIFLIWIPFLAAMAYMMIADRTPVFKLWSAQDSLSKVADDLLTGKIDTPPDWATKDTVGLVSAMQTNVHHNAYDAERWYRMSEIFLALEAPEQGLESLSRAHRLKPDDEKIALTYAQTSFFTQGGMMTPEIRQVVEHILTKNPNHQGAQMLMAMGEMRAGNYDAARQWVGKLKAELQTRPGDHQQALQSLTELEANISEREQASKQAINVTITITPEVLGRVKKGDTLFVSVRPIAGGPPVAAKKLSADSLNKSGLTLNISDNDSLMPTQKLSDAILSKAQLVVTARISSTGDAMPVKGDLTSNPVPLAEVGQTTTVLIDKIVP